MTTGEREMVRPLDENDAVLKASRAERFTSLQPTYEDSVAPRPDYEDWDDEE